MKKRMKVRYCIAALAALAVFGGVLIALFGKMRWADGEEQEHYEVMKQENICYRDGMRIVGTLYMPQNGKDFQGIVILSHGLGGDASGCERYAYILAKAGIAAYTFDFCGGSKKGKSDGRTEDMTVMTELADLESVIEMAKSWEWVDERHIVLMGLSQGGLVSALAAARRDDIESLVLFYPAFSISDIMKRVFSDIEYVPDTFTFMDMELGKAYYQDSANRDFYEEASGFKNEVLIVHGTRDSVIAYGSSKKMMKYYQNAQLYTVRGGGHGFYDAEVAALSDTLIAFVRSQMTQEIREEE